MIEQQHSALLTGHSRGDGSGYQRGGGRCAPQEHGTGQLAQQQPGGQSTPWAWGARCGFQSPGCRLQGFRQVKTPSQIPTERPRQC